jgi:predicted kinase
MTNKLYILCGIPFSGKTHFAKEFASLTGYLRIDLDEIKFYLMGPGVKDQDITQSDWDKIYKEMYRQIKEALVSGRTVVHDTGNFTSHERKLIGNIAKELNLPHQTIYVDTQVEIARLRMLANRNNQTRFDISDKEFESAVNEMEQPTDLENYLVYDGSSSTQTWIEQNQL